ncbi:LCP family protein [Anaerolineales bacterium HSG24]|nr:LCP family protein [Anaerolineales bacterium HSG24]
MTSWANFRVYISIISLLGLILACNGSQIKQITISSTGVEVVTEQNQPQSAFSTADDLKTPRNIIPREIVPIIGLIQQAHQTLISIQQQSIQPTLPVETLEIPVNSADLTMPTDELIPMTEAELDAMWSPKTISPDETLADSISVENESMATTETAPSARPVANVEVIPASSSVASSPVESHNTLQPISALTDTQTVSNSFNILLMGADKRPGGNVGRSDTIIVVSINPLSKTVAMLSFPRDLWVTIPNYGTHRINAAYLLGERTSPNGGGIRLMQETIEQNFGLKTDYHAQINFDGFERVVDTLGGIELDIPELHDTARFYGFTPSYINKASHYSFIPSRVVDAGKPTANASELITQTLVFTSDAQLSQIMPEPGYRMVYLEAGRQVIDGETALQYARSRASVTADFARMKRQQAILLAIRKQALQTDVLPRIPELWSDLHDTIQTDLSLLHIIKLASIAKTIQLDGIQTATIDHTMTNDYRTDKGARVLLPDYEKIGELIEEMFED